MFTPFNYIEIVVKDLKSKFSLHVCRVGNCNNSFQDGYSLVPKGGPSQVGN